MTQLIIAEKPKAAGRIAYALAEGNVKKQNRGRAVWYEIRVGDEKTYVVPAVGHIFTLEQKGKGWDYPVFDPEWRPTHEVRKGSKWMKNYYDNLKRLSNKADRFVNACDFDQEGCLISEEKVVVKRNGKIEIIEAGELIDELIEKSDRVKETGEFEYTETNFKILAMDDWEVKFRDVNKAMRRPSESSYLEITAQFGRKIKVSKNHPILMASEAGLSTKKASEIRGGDFIPVSKEIPDNEEIKKLDLIDMLDEIYVHGFKDNMGIMPSEMCKIVDKTRKQCLNYRHNNRIPKEFFLEMEDSMSVERENLTVTSPKGTTKLQAKIDLDYSLGRFLGLYLAEGCIDSSGFIGLYFGPEEETLVKEVEEFFEGWGIEGKTRKRHISSSMGESKCFEVGTKTRVLRELLEKLNIGTNSGNKKLPSWILSAPKDFKKGLLTGYWDGDGSVFVESKDERVIASAGSKSRGLLDDFFYLLQSLGINASFQEWKERKMTNLTVGRNEDVSKMVSILGSDEEIDEKLAGKTPRNMHNMLNTLPSCLSKRQEIIGKNKGNENYSKRTALSSIKEWEEEMKNYPQGDLTFLEVKSVEERECPDKFFYDFETDTGNFLHGNGVITHNSVIGYNILKFIVGTENAGRMKFSTLTTSDLQEAYEDISEELDMGMVESGLARHVLDWLWGINLSRALTLSVKKVNSFHILSTGRVQGPALKILAEKEKEIQKFEPEDYWVLEALLKSDKEELTAYHEKDRFWEEGEAQEIKEKCEKNRAEVGKVQKSKFKHNPPWPFDLSTLQSEAYSAFKFSPSKTLKVAQSLYESGLISYPRSSSQKLPPKIGYQQILKKLKNQKKYRKLAEKVLDKSSILPKQGKKRDKAHPAIYPTGAKPKKTSKDERKLYDLIVKRYFAVFGNPALRESVKLKFILSGEIFEAKGKRTLEENWFELYKPYLRVKEQELPDLKKGEMLNVEKIDKLDKQTQPPKRYTQASLVTEMKKKNLGTKATRSQIIDKLYDRGYVDGSSLKVTDLGMSVVETLQKYSPQVLSEEMTRKFEEEMEKIQEGENTKEKVIEEAEEKLGEILEEIKGKEEEIGQDLKQAVIRTERKKSELGECPECGGTLKVIKTKKAQFVGCSNYPDCENSFPLPQKAKIIPLDKPCKECGLSKVKVVRKGKRPFTMCISPDCKTKENWGKNNKKKKGKK